MRELKAKDVLLSLVRLCRPKKTQHKFTNTSTYSHSRTHHRRTSWALFSDIDITSEKYRCCGGFRFTARAVELLFCDGCVRPYKGTLHYLPSDAVGSNSTSTPVTAVTAQPGAAAAAEGSNTQLHDHNQYVPPINEPIGEAHRAAGWQTIEANDFRFFLAAMQVIR